MFSRILVPLGDSPHTTQALTNACELATIFESEIHCLYVSDVEKIRPIFASSVLMPEIPTPTDPLFEAKILESAQHELNSEEKIALEYFEKWKEKYPNIKMQLEKAGGIVWEEILQRQKNIDLIVMGKSVYDEEDIPGVAGKNFLKVIHKSHLPVLVCTRDHPIGADLLACYDGKKPALKVLNIATEVAKKFKAPLNILTIDGDLNKAKKINDEAAQIARDDGVGEVKSIIHNLNVVGSILGEIEHLNINFLFMGAYGESLLKDLLLGSTTDEIIRQTGCPILLYR